MFKRKPLIHFLRAFGCVVSILNTQDRLSKFKPRSVAGYFVGYSSVSKAYRVYSTRKNIVEETIEVTLNEHMPVVDHTRPEWMFDINAFTKSFDSSYDVSAGINELPVFEVTLGGGLRPMGGFGDYTVDPPLQIGRATLHSPVVHNLNQFLVGMLLIISLLPVLFRHLKPLKLN
jgi:hypothetical protein